MTKVWWPTALSSRRSGSRPGPAPEFVEPITNPKLVDGRFRPWPGRISPWRPADEASRSQPGKQAAQAQLTGTAGRAAGRKLAEVARGSTLNLIGAAFSTVITIAITVLVTRLFTGPVAGAFFSATSLFLIVESVASLGAYTGAVYFIARLRLIGAEGRISLVLRAAIIPVVIASLTGGAVLLIFASPLASLLLGGHLGRDGATVPAVATALRALAVTLPFAALLDTLLGASRGYRNMRPSVVIDKLARSALQLVAVTIAVTAGSAALLAPLWAVPYIPAAAAAWIWLRRIRRPYRPGLTARRVMPPELAALQTLASPVLIGHAPVRTQDRPPGGRPGRPSTTEPVNGESSSDRWANVDTGVFWRFTSPRAVATLAQIMIQRIDIVLVAILRGPTEAAIYTAATRFLVAGQLGSVAISSAAQPQFTELFAMGSLHRANVVYRTTTAWLILLTWPLYLLIMVNGEQFLKIFGHSYTAGDTVLIILALSMLLSAACGQVDVVLITAGRSSWSLANGLLAMVVNVSLDLSLIPRWGITGAAIAWAAAIVVANLMPLAQLAISMRLSPFGRDTFIACALCAVAFGGIPLAARVLLGHATIGIGSGALLGTAMMCVGLWCFREPLRLSMMPGVSHFIHNRSKI